MSRRVLLFAVLFALVAAGFVWDRANVNLVRSEARPRPDAADATIPDDPDEIVLVLGGSHESLERPDSIRTRPADSPRQTEPAPRDVERRPRPSAKVAERRVRVAAGETLRAIAARELGDPALWTVLAERNGIDDPTRLRAGDEIVVPLGTHR